MEERPKYPESLSEVMEDADNREPSVMDTLYGLPFPSEGEYGYNEGSDARNPFMMDEEFERMVMLYASPSPGLLGIIRKLFGR